jgi:hypothetical protein
LWPRVPGSDVTTATRLLVEEESDILTKNAVLLGWTFNFVDPENFVLGMPARDKSEFFLWCACDRYGAIPPAWHWYNPETKLRDQAQDTPCGGNFFHGNGVICAPWNRIAYGAVDARGPHGDWELANWRVNPNTGACKTLSAMALRIFCELMASTFSGRRS